MLRAAGGFTPAALAALAHLLHTVGPALVVLVQKWAGLLPGKKKGSAPEAAAAAAEASSSGAGSGGGGGARTALREAVMAAVDGMGKLREALASEEGGEGEGGERPRPAACVCLAEQEERWSSLVSPAAPAPSFPPRGGHPPSVLATAPLKPRGCCVCSALSQVRRTAEGDAARGELLRGLEAEGRAALAGFGMLAKELGAMLKHAAKAL